MIMLDHNTLHENHKLLKLSGYGDKKTLQKRVYQNLDILDLQKQDDKLMHNLVIMYMFVFHNFPNFDFFDIQ